MEHNEEEIVEKPAPEVEASPEQEEQPDEQQQADTVETDNDVPVVTETETEPKAEIEAEADPEIEIAGEAANETEVTEETTEEAEAAGADADPGAEAEAAEGESEETEVEAKTEVETESKPVTEAIESEPLLEETKEEHPPVKESPPVPAPVTKSTPAPAPAHYTPPPAPVELPSSIQVEIKFGEGIPSKLLTVHIAKDFDKKHFIGGYRNKKSGIEYHHCEIQTEKLKRPPKPKPLQFTRALQTAGISRSQQTVREAFTQMARPDLFIDATGDRWYTPKPYFSAARLLDLKIEKSIKIQAYVRGWFARKLANQLREEEYTKQKEVSVEQERRKLEHNAKQERERQRRRHPRTAADFGILRNELEAWRLQETNRIKEQPGEKTEQQKQLQELLKKETQLLHTINEMRIKAGKANRGDKINNTLKAMSAEKKWQTPKTESGYTAVETPFTVRSKELMELYNGLQMRGLSIDERLDVLLHVKWTVKEFECALTREIVELIDREADLLNRGRPQKSLENLRQRMVNLFLQFIETPEFNPQAIHHQRVPLEFTVRPLVQLQK